MSRIAQKPMARASNSNLRAPSQPQLRKSPSGQLRKSPTKGLGSSTRPQGREPSETEGPPPKTNLSIKEQIALKRAEAAKAKAAQSQGGSQASNFTENIQKLANDADEIMDLGRWSIIETIERAKTSGSLNLSSRMLVCIPASLFETHLQITPRKLSSVTEPEAYSKRTTKTTKEYRAPKWFEARDLEMLNVRNNEIIEIQPEICLFGSLKVIDLHRNALTSVPETLVNLATLETLDLSSNMLTELPPALFSLPSLAVLDISQNNLTSLPFAKFNIPAKPFALSDSVLFSSEGRRSKEPLPNLRSLDASHNKLSAESIDTNSLPKGLEVLKLSHNPLGMSSKLIRVVQEMTKLEEVLLDHTDLGNDSFTNPTKTMFSKLRVFDATETQTTRDVMELFFAVSDRRGQLSFYLTTSEPKEGELRVLVGKRVIREPWEIEAEEHAHKKSVIVASDTVVDLEDEARTIEARARRSAERTESMVNYRQTISLRIPYETQVNATPPPPKPPQPVKVVEKEAWEIEAEQGLLTEGGRRRARAQATAAAVSKSNPVTTSGVISLSSPPTSLSNPTYYNESTLTLTLPTSALLPSKMRGHWRAVSLAVPSQREQGGSAEDLVVPTPTIPLHVIATQPFAATLRVLILNGRKANRMITVPALAGLSSSTSFSNTLPCLEELALEDCMLEDDIPLRHGPSENAMSTSEGAKRVSTIEYIADLFPSLLSLNLSYNYLTSASLTNVALSTLLVPAEATAVSAKRRGLKILQLRSNRITHLEAFETIGTLFKANRQVDNWQFEELDLRDNDIAKLPPMLGLIPMDILLVEGNTFRVPARKVWEREGTKGLLAWLRGRME